MAKKQEYICKSCKQQFIARVADRKRGWARFCSKRCKAIHQEQKTGQYSRLRSGVDYGWDGHKNSF